MKVRNRVLIVCGVILALGIGVYYWDKRGEGFRLAKIQEDTPYDSRWDVSVTEADIQAVRSLFASQKFTYLAHGFQCYVFQSENKQYVVKFFRYQRLRLPEFIESLPSLPWLDQWRKERTISLTHRRNCLLRSFKTSWDLAKSEAALIFMHLNHTNGLLGTAQIRDPLGNEYTIPMDHYQFMVQYKASHMKPEFDRLMKAGDTAGAKKRIDQIFDLLLDCSKKSVQDMDGALIRKDNLGFLPDRAIYIDSGKLVYHPSIRSKACFEKDLKRLKPLQKWLSETYPVLADHFDAKQEDVLAHFDELVNG